jgi:hypothetical protein
MATVYPDFDRDGYFLQHAVILSQLFPGSFAVPPPEERFGIREGSIVKLSFCFAKEEEEKSDYDTERMWVVVKSRLEDHWIGVLDNDPQFHHSIKSGHEFHFHSDHIFALWKG